MPVAPNWPLINAQKELQRRRAELPVQLMAGRGGFQTRPYLDYFVSDQERPLQIEALKCTPQAQADATTNGCATVHPTMLLAVLRRKLEAPARVWLLLRHIDNGRGCLALDEARRQLTGPDSPLRVCASRGLPARVSTETVT